MKFNRTQASVFLTFLQTNPLFYRKYVMPPKPKNNPTSVLTCFQLSSSLVKPVNRAEGKKKRVKTATFHEK